MTFFSSPIGNSLKKYEQFTAISATDGFIMLFVDCFKIHVMAESILERPEVLMALELSDWIFSRVRIIGSKVLQ